MELCAICNLPAPRFVIDLERRLVCKPCQEPGWQIREWLRLSDAKDAADPIAMDGHYE